MNVLWIAIGGALGSVLRYAISMALQGGTGLFPLGTMTVNIVGSLLLGALFSMQEGNSPITNEMWLLLSVGLCGGFTTFSTFGLETYVLWKEKHVVEAVLYMMSSLVAAPASIALGYALMKTFKG
ncbi:MAG: fluoride efflux transporter CrcB [bacterium]